MRNLFSSTLAAIALAVPLGIGGLAFAASPAEAFIQALKHHFNTCSRDVIWECEQRIHTYVLGFVADRSGDSNVSSANFLYSSRALPYGSNGADQAAYDWLTEGIHDPNMPNRSWYARDHIFPDGSPAEVARRKAAEAARQADEQRRIAAEHQARYEAQLRANQERTFARFRDDCARYSGEVVFHPDIEDGVYRCEGGTGSLTQYTGYDADNPDVYTVALQISPVEPLSSLAEIAAIEDHRQATSVNRETIVTIVDEFNTLEERVLAHNDRIAENGFLIDAVADRLVAVDDRARKNTAGIALGYALGTPGLLPDKRFAFGGGVGSFEGENGVAFTLTGRFTDSIVANVGGGMAGSGYTSVSGFKGAVSFQW